MLWFKPFINWGFLFVQLITAILAILCLNKSRSIVRKTFIAVWVLTFLVEVAGKIMGLYRINNIWLYNLFDIAFYPGIILIYADVFEKSRLKWAAILSAFCLVILAVTYLASRSNSSLNTYYTIFADSFIIFFALTYLVKLFLDKEITTPLRNDPYYWFSAGFIVYFVFNAVMLGMYNTITESKLIWLPDFTFYAGHLITLVLHICLWAGFTAFLKWTK
jgi:hypothetical protein